MRRKTTNNMELTTEILKERFDKYNKEYFNGELFTPELLLKRSFKTMGLFECTKKSLQRGRRIWGAKIHISSYFNWTEEFLRDVLVHEMIHFYLAKKHIDDNLSHGEEFLKMANRFNEEYGMNIAVTYEGRKMGRSKEAPRISWFLKRMFC